MGKSLDLIAGEARVFDFASGRTPDEDIIHLE
jgi:hypothetical protein